MGESISLSMRLDRADGILSSMLVLAFGIAILYSSKSIVSWNIVIIGAFGLLRWIGTKYVINVSETTLSITKRMLGFHLRTRNYPISEISSLRVAQQRIFFWLSYATLMFERNGKTIVSGVPLNNSSVAWLNPIYQRFPNLRPA
jgi:hypothetical protein